MAFLRTSEEDTDLTRECRHGGTGCGAMCRPCWFARRRADEDKGTAELQGRVFGAGFAFSLGRPDTERVCGGEDTS